MKVLLFSDVHWSTSLSIITARGAKYSKRLETLISSMNWVETVGKDLNCDLEICLGDFFDKPNLMAEEITALNEITWNDIPKKFIIGNHDASNKSLEFNSVEVLGAHNFELISLPKSESYDKFNFVFIPYSQDYTKINSSLLVPNDTQTYYFTHADLKGLQLGKYTSTEGIDINAVESPNIIFNGHLHNGGWVNGNVLNVGTLSASNFTNNSAEYSYGIYILDTDKGTVDFIENPYAFNFYKYEVKSDRDLDKLRNLHENDILSILCSEKYLEQVNELTKNNITRITITYEPVADSEDEVQLIDDLRVGDHIKQFIEFVQTKLEPSSILDEELLKLGGLDEHSVSEG